MKQSNIKQPSPRHETSLAHLDDQVTESTTKQQTSTPLIKQLFNENEYLLRQTKRNEKKMRLYERRITQLTKQLEEAQLLLKNQKNNLYEENKRRAQQEQDQLTAIQTSIHSLHQTLQLALQQENHTNTQLQSAQQLIYNQQALIHELEQYVKKLTNHFQIRSIEET